MFEIGLDSVTAKIINLYKQINNLQKKIKTFSIKPVPVVQQETVFRVLN